MAIWLIRTLAIAVALAAVASADSQTPPERPELGVRSLLGNRSLLDAHNCYPEDDQWRDRLERALATGQSRMAIEQDVAWLPPSGGRPGRSVVSHDATLSETEPTLEEHFFARIRPIMERELAAKQTYHWPVLILHLDFKTNEPEHHRTIWDLLARHRDWLTTAERVADPAAVTPFRAGPLLVLTENSPGQQATFFDRVLIGERLLLFGTTPNPALPGADDPEAPARVAATAAPAALIPWTATSYHRWTNFAWNVVERGGQRQAADWTEVEAARLKAIVARAHEQGLWVRFYTLNGHAPSAGRGWSSGYNFGSAAAVHERWQSAIDAGVDFVATDQYEDFALMLPRGDRGR